MFQPFSSREIDDANRNGNGRPATAVWTRRNARSATVMTAGGRDRELNPTCQRRQRHPLCGGRCGAARRRAAAGAGEAPAPRVPAARAPPRWLTRSTRAVIRVPGQARWASRPSQGCAVTIFTGFKFQALGRAPSRFTNHVPSGPARRRAAAATTDGYGQCQAALAPAATVRQRLAGPAGHGAYGALRLRPPSQCWPIRRALVPAAGPGLGARRQGGTTESRRNQWCGGLRPAGCAYVSGPGNAIDERDRTFVIGRCFGTSSSRPWA